jgi:hypothetical protein
MNRIEMEWPLDIEGEHEDAQTFLERLIGIHCKGSGPVGFQSILAWVRQQHPDGRDIPDDEVRCAIAELVERGRIELYDTGDAWW